MNVFTKQNLNCFWGSVTNILNSYDIQISEAELVLFSNVLNCLYVTNESNLYFGIPNQGVYPTLKMLGVNVHKLKCITELLEVLHIAPVLLKVNTSALVYSDVYKGTSRTHFIVLLSLNGNQAQISDSFVSSIPRSCFEGITDITQVIQNCKAKKDFGTALLIKSEQETNLLYQKEKSNAYSMLISYAKTNIEMSEESVIRKYQLLSQYMLGHTEQMLIEGRINEFVYMLKFNGAIDRLLYLAELVQRYCNAPASTIDILSSLYGKWISITNKLLKCAILKSSEIYKRIFEKDIPMLLNEERNLYVDLIKTEESI